MYHFLTQNSPRLVHMALECVNIPYQYIEVDVLKGETRTEEYMKVSTHQMAKKGCDFF